MDANQPPAVLELLTGDVAPKLDAPDGQTYVDVSEIWVRRDGKWKRKGKA